jgi:hypothetical protein
MCVSVCVCVCLSLSFAIILCSIARTNGQGRRDQGASETTCEGSSNEPERELERKSAQRCCVHM